MGIIQKIKFGDVAEVYPEDYLKKIREWEDWNTPRKYEKLDGKGRKLILYDRTREAITVEVEVRKVKKTNQSRRFSWTNYFEPDTLHVYRESEQIPLSHIRSIPGFENFSRYRKDRTAFRNITHTQYEQLIGYRGK